MKRLLALLAGAGGVAVLLRRRRASVASSEPGPDPAEELRRKLAESRAVVDARDEDEGAETTVEQAEPTGGDLDARRRALHERGRAAADEMRGGAGG